MPKTYTDAPEIVAAAAVVMERYHPDLAEAGVTVKCLFVETDTAGPAISFLTSFWFFPQKEQKRFSVSFLFPIFYASSSSSSAGF